jgi:glycosyltransferase involved in cell wall biosynthesis
MIKILYDNQCFSLQRYGGVSRYFAELMSGIKNEQNIKLLPGRYYSNNDYLQSKGLTYYKKFRDYRNFRGKIRIENYILEKENKQIERFISSGNFDIFHPTYYDIKFLDLIPNDKPFVVTIHDMIYEIYYDPLFECLTDITKQKAILINKANHIIAVSENTKRDILSVYPHISEKKISVVYHGASLSSNKETYITDTLPEKFFLYVGARKYYKNFLWMLKSISGFLKKTNYTLICAGAGEFDGYESKIIEEENLNKNIIHYKITNDFQLLNLYKKATCLIFPSLLEGFGIPILEAFESGCPVILSKSSCFPEIASHAALYFEVEDKEGLINQLYNLIIKKELPDELKHKGFERLKLFDWKKSVEQHKNIYELILKKSI